MLKQSTGRGVRAARQHKMRRSMKPLLFAGNIILYSITTKLKSYPFDLLVDLIRLANRFFPSLVNTGRHFQAIQTDTQDSILTAQIPMMPKDMNS